MITITRRLALQLRSTFRRALGVTNKAAAPPLRFTAGPAGLTVGAQTAGITAELTEPGERPPDDILVPYACLAECEGRKDEDVVLERSGDEIVARWTDGDVPQVANFVAPDADGVSFLPVPENLTENPPALLAALRDASDTADSEATRYALNTVQLFDGRVSATDGRQIFVEGRFSFPWDGEVRIAANNVFGAKDLPRDAPVLVGRSDDWLMLRVGPWTFQFAIEKEGRFPKIQDNIKSVASAKSHLRLSEDDALFLTKTIKRLPCDDDYNLPVTVDLNGCVAVRARSESQQEPTELVLNQSVRDGDPIAFNTNRKYLVRAAQLGLRDFYLYGPEQPAQCCNGSRTYVWAVLKIEDAIKSSANATRIESAPCATVRQTDKRKPHPTTRRAMPRSTSNSNGNGRANTGNEPDAGTEVLIEQAETLKASLRDSVTKVNELVAGLKRHRKHTKLVTSTLASLKQLQSLDV